MVVSVERRCVDSARCAAHRHAADHYSGPALGAGNLCNCPGRVDDCSFSSCPALGAIINRALRKRSVIFVYQLGDEPSTLVCVLTLTRPELRLQRSLSIMTLPIQS